MYNSISIVSSHLHLCKSAFLGLYSIELNSDLSNFNFEEVSAGQQAAHTLGGCIVVL